MNQIESGCGECQVSVKTENRDPLEPTKLPEACYAKVAMDHYGLVTDHRGKKKHLIVVIDLLTKFLDVGVVKSTAATHNVPIYDKIFKIHGYPRKLMSDNGPPFNIKGDHLFQRYLKWAGITHIPM